LVIETSLHCEVRTEKHQKLNVLRTRNDNFRA